MVNIGLYAHNTTYPIVDTTDYLNPGIESRTESRTV